MKNVFIIYLLVLSSCASLSIKEASKIYFKNYKNLYATEAPKNLEKRLADNLHKYHILYTHEDNIIIKPCILLRNQLYAASLSNLTGKDGQLIRKLALDLEDAYQSDDINFLITCQNILNLEIGRVFLATQKEFTGSKDS